MRGFNRFYTNVIGLLRGKYLDKPYSLTESRLRLSWASGKQACSAPARDDIHSNKKSIILTNEV